jgi:hypothetical protein
MFFKQLIIATSLCALPCLAMESSDESGTDFGAVSNNNNNNNNNNASQADTELSWDTQFKLGFYRHGKILSDKEFQEMKPCLIAPLWEAYKAQGDLKALAEFVYFSIPAVPHRATCPQCKGSTYMNLLAASGNDEFMREVLTIWQLCQRLDKIDLVNIKGFANQTPMHSAVGDQDKFPGKTKATVSMVQLLGEHGGDYSMREKNYEVTPLGLASMSREPRCARIAHELLSLPESEVDDSAFRYLATQYKKANILDEKETYPLLEEQCHGYEQLCTRIKILALYEQSDSEQS